MSLITCDTNNYYGHASILLKYIGIEEDIKIRGRIQHGWTANAGIYYDKLVEAGERLFVWNKRFGLGYNEERDSIELPEESVRIIGAPYIYRTSIKIHEKPEGILVFPNHSTAAKLLPTEAWDNYITELRDYVESLGFYKTTVSLFYKDYTTELKNKFKSKGIDVFCAGGLGDKDFLDNVEKQLLMHEAVAASCVSTQVFYSLWHGKATIVGGPHIVPQHVEHYDYKVGNKDWIKSNYPKLLHFCTDKSIAEEELGLEFKKSPSGLLDEIFY